MKPIARAVRVQRRVLALVVPLALIQASCTTQPVTGGGPVAPGAVANGAPPGPVDLRNPAYRQQLTTSLQTKGWIPFGTGSLATGVEPDAFYVNPGSVRRAGETVSVSQLNVLSAQAAAKAGYASVVSIREFNCTNRTWRIADARAFNDRTVSTVAGKQPSYGNSFQPLTDGSIALTTYNAVCEGKGSGTGIVIADSRLLTNLHVVDRCRKLEVSLAGKKVDARVLASDRQNDLALIEVAGLSAARPLSVRRSPTIGEAVTVAGYPLTSILGSDLNVQTGIVNSLTGLANSTTNFQLSATVQPGNSGGPVLDRSGNLIGVVVAKLTAQASAQVNATNVNFAIKPEIVRLFLSTNQVPVTETDAGPRLEPEDIAARAKGVTAKVDCSQRMLGA